MVKPSGHGRRPTIRPLHLQFRPRAAGVRHLRPRPSAGARADLDQPCRARLAEPSDAASGRRDGEPAQAGELRLSRRRDVGTRCDRHVLRRLGPRPRGGCRRSRARAFCAVGHLRRAGGSHRVRRASPRAREPSRRLWRLLSGTAAARRVSGDDREGARDAGADRAGLGQRGAGVPSGLHLADGPRRDGRAMALVHRHDAQGELAANRPARAAPVADDRCERSRSTGALPDIGTARTARRDRAIRGRQVDGVADPGRRVSHPG